MGSPAYLSITRGHVGGVRALARSPALAVPGCSQKSWLLPVHLITTVDFTLSTFRRSRGAIGRYQASPGRRGAGAPLGLAAPAAQVPRRPWTGRLRRATTIPGVEVKG